MIKQVGKDVQNAIVMLGKKLNHLYINSTLICWGLLRKHIFEYKYLYSNFEFSNQECSVNYV